MGEKLTLTELRQKQNKDFFDLAMGKPREQLFAFYVSWHPKLYEGVDLDKATIDYINNYFYEYKVDVQHFHRHFLNALRHATPIYNNLKAIEFSKKVFCILTNRSVRKLASTAIANLQENGEIIKLRNDSGTITDSGSVKDNGSETTSNRIATDTDNNSRTANKELPMRANGDFEELFDWNGASNVSEVNEQNEKVENANGTTTDNRMTYTGNVRTLATQIRNEDTNNLTKINNETNNDKETIERISGQGVDLIKKIWNYIITPKAIDYLIEELEEAFITVM